MTFFQLAAMDVLISFRNSHPVMFNPPPNPAH